MKDKYYAKPLQFDVLFEKEELPKIDLGESISQHIELIIFSHLGEHSFDRAYGCKIWEYDFELIVSATVWEEKFQKAILEAVSRSEKRLTAISVEVQLSEIERVYPVKKIIEVKKKLMIDIRAILLLTGEKFFFTTDLFLSPISG